MRYESGLCRGLMTRIMLAMGLLGAVVTAVAQTPPAPVRELRVVGSLASLNLYTHFEEPFWTRDFPVLTNGEYKATIEPFDRLGIRGQDMLRLLQVGTIPMGTALISQVASSEPRLGLLTLAGMTSDSAGLRNALQAFRPHMDRILRERYGIESLAVYIYPAQTVFCREAIRGLADIKGRKVRVSSITQSDLVQALGAMPVQTPFHELIPTLRSGRLDCAITGTMSGNNIGLDQVTTHMLELPINWGGTFFGVNMQVWQGFTPAQQENLRRALAQLERRVWAEEMRQTQEGTDCNAGRSTCTMGRKGSMIIVPVTSSDRVLLRRSFEQQVLPRWIDRCGPACVPLWNDSIARVVGVKAKAAK